MYTNMASYEYAYISRCVSAYISLHRYAHTCTYTNVNRRAYTYPAVHIYTYIYMQRGTYGHIHKCIYPQASIYMYIYKLRCMQYSYVNTSIYTWNASTGRTKMSFQSVVSPPPFAAWLLAPLCFILCWCSWGMVLTWRRVEGLKRDRSRSSSSSSTCFSLCPLFRSFKRMGREASVRAQAEANVCWGRWPTSADVYCQQASLNVWRRKRTPQNTSWLIRCIKGN